ncbi:MAG: hypothetical protein KDD69_14405, partial [Bdellovibrionales bacterium]|nr:hypothetical protein [Bdellovibrionales bacterium]
MELLLVARQVQEELPVVLRAVPVVLQAVPVALRVVPVALRVVPVVQQAVPVALRVVQAVAPEEPEQYRPLLLLRRRQVQLEQAELPAAPEPVPEQQLQPGCNTHLRG